MSQADLSRIREDLATMKQAAGVGLPFGREDVRLSLAWAGAGLPVAALVAWTPVEPWVLAVLIGIPAALVLALTARVSKKYHRRRAQAPIRWREHRHQWVLAAIMVPPLGGFWIWAINKGLSPEALTAAAVFMAGLAYLIPPIVDRKRLLYLGWAISTMLLSVAAPLCGYRYIGVAVGAWLMVAGLSAAAIMTWQLRTNVNDHGPD